MAKRRAKRRLPEEIADLSLESVGSREDRLKKLEQAAPWLKHSPYLGFDPEKDPFLRRQVASEPITGTYGDAGKGLLASIASIPGDVQGGMDMLSQLIKMPISMRAAASLMPGNIRLPTSDAMGRMLGADTESEAYNLGLIGTPDVGDVAKLGGKGLLEAMTLFHGTPHKFKNFDSKFIGTGEGHTAYGHGLYFAQNPKVAGSYKIAGQGAPLRYEDQPVSSLYHGIGVDRGDLKALSAISDDVSLADVRANLANGVYGDKTDDVKRLLESGKVTENTGGHLYEVDIPDDITAKMLDWDAPLSEQPESVKRALKQSFGKEIEASPFSTGRQFYKRMSDSHLMPPEFRGKGEAGVSEFLNSQGIPGIRYYDGASRGKQAGQSIQKIGSSFEGLDIASSSENIMDQVGGFHELLPDVRKVNFSDVDIADSVLMGNKSLSSDILKSNKIEPLLVVQGTNGELRVSEGLHRAKALKELGYTSFPARVAVPKGTRNIVVFDENIIKSVKRDGEKVYSQ